MEFITVEQFREQSIEVQKVFLDYWRANLRDIDLVGYIGKSKAYEECFPSLVRNINIKCFEIGIEIIPLFTEGQIRKFIEDKLGVFLNIEIRNVGFIFWNFRISEEGRRKLVEYNIVQEDFNLLQAYWKIACMIANDEVE